MATTVIEYVSCFPLNCGDLPAEVVLCVPPEIIQPLLCPESVTEGFTGLYKGINATILQSVCTQPNCQKLYKYNISYDTAELIPDAVLNVLDITGVVCKNCTTDWIEGLIGGEPYLHTDETDGTQYFISPHGCAYQLNSATLGFTVEDTNSVDLTLAGILLSADVKISEDIPCNALIETSDGLYVAGLATTTTDSAVTNLTLDSNCNSISVDVKVSDDAGNLIEIRGDGLYATEGALPAGLVFPYAGTSAPTGYLLCDGSAVSRTTYAAIFAVTGVIYGAGNGTTTFNIPDLRQKFPLGKAASGTGNALGATGGAIDHVHTQTTHSHVLSGAGWAKINLTANPFAAPGAVAMEEGVTAWNATAALVGSSTSAYTAPQSQGVVLGGNTEAAVLGNTTANNPPYLVLNYIIKT